MLFFLLAFSCGGFVLIQSGVGLNLRFLVAKVILLEPQASNSSRTSRVQCKGQFVRGVFSMSGLPLAFILPFALHPKSVCLSQLSLLYYMSFILCTGQPDGEGGNGFSDVTMKPQSQASTVCLGLRRTAFSRAPLSSLAVFPGSSQVLALSQGQCFVLLVFPCSVSQKQQVLTRALR